jgi:hypothetical protein
VKEAIGMPRHDSRGSPAGRRDVRRKSFRKRLKIGVFAATALAVLGLAVFLVVLPLAGGARASTECDRTDR